MIKPQIFIALKLKKNPVLDIGDKWINDINLVSDELWTA